MNVTVVENIALILGQPEDNSITKMNRIFFEFAVFKTIGF